MPSVGFEPRPSRTDNEHSRPLDRLGTPFLRFFFVPVFPLFQSVSCPGFMRRPSGVESLGLNRLSGEGVNLVADWGLNTG